MNITCLLFCLFLRVRKLNVCESNAALHVVSLTPAQSGIFNSSKIHHSHRRGTDVCQHYYIITSDQDHLWAQRTDIQTPDNVLQTTSVVVPATRRRKNSTTRFILYFLKWKFKSYKRGQTPCDLIMKHFPASRCVLGRICMFMVLICKREYSIRGLFAYTLHTHTHTHCVRTHLHVPLVWPHSQRWVSLVFSI